MKPVKLVLDDRTVEVTKVGAKAYRKLQAFLKSAQGRTLFGSDDQEFREEDLTGLIALVVELVGKRATRAEIEDCSIDDLFNFCNDIITALNQSVTYHVNEDLKDFFTRENVADLVSKLTGDTSKPGAALSLAENEQQKTAS